MHPLSLGFVFSVLEGTSNRPISLTLWLPVKHVNLNLNLSLFASSQFRLLSCPHVFVLPNKQQALNFSCTGAHFISRALYFAPFISCAQEFTIRLGLFLEHRSSQSDMICLSCSAGASCTSNLLLVHRCMHRWCSPHNFSCLTVWISTMSANLGAKGTGMDTGFLCAHRGEGRAW